MAPPAVTDEVNGSAIRRAGGRTVAALEGRKGNTVQDTVYQGDGRFAGRLNQLAKLDLLDDRICIRSALITNPLPVKQWHTYLVAPTLADAILDRIVFKLRSYKGSARSYWPASSCARASKQNGIGQAANISI